MFDDPKKELRRLQEELLAEEDEGWDDLSDIQDLLDGYEEEDDVEELLRQYGSESQPPIYLNYANGYGRRQPHYEEVLPEMDEDAAVFREEPRKRKRSENRGLVVLAALETLGILAILVWWAVMML